MNWQPTADLAAIKFRADVIDACRRFFQRRGVLEVTTPALSPCATTDPNINSFAVTAQRGAQPYYLHTSPELAMKRLLAAGSGSIYQLCSVFRDSDRGRYHHREYTMLEWYRVAWGYQRLMDEVEALVRELPAKSAPEQTQRWSYRDLFLHYLDLDPFTANSQQCRNCCEQHRLPLPDTMPEQLDPWLDLLIGGLIAPRLPGHCLTFIYDFPASQAALAQTHEQDGFAIALRFELYWGKIELANGFQELTEAGEQRRRFEQENAERIKRGQAAMPIDERFLAALVSGVPECSGVALGFDRLLMALAEIDHIKHVVTFAGD